MNKKYLLGLLFFLGVLVFSFSILKEKNITGNVVTWREGCDSNYLESLWEEIFFVSANSSGYFNEVTNSDGSTNCKINSYVLEGSSLYAFLLSSNSYETKEELNFTAYFVNLTASGQIGWNNVNKESSTSINSLKS